LLISVGFTVNTDVLGFSVEKTFSETLTLVTAFFDFATDDDTLQRLFSEIFGKDVDELREYYANEDVWSEVVSLLDMEERAGWDLLGKLLLAREEVSDWYKNGGDEDVELTSAQVLLGHPFFKMKIM